MMRRITSTILGSAVLAVAWQGWAQNAQPVEWARDGLAVLLSFAPAGSGAPVPTEEEALADLIVAGDVTEPAPEIPGVTFQGDGSLLATEAPTERVTQTVRESGELTVEAWLKPASSDQSGPARIVSVSDGTETSRRNFTLGQQGSRYIFRLRTDAEDAEAGFRVKERQTPEQAALPQNQHVAVTYANCRHCGAGILRFFVNGELLAEHRDLRGGFARWDGGLRLLLGNEASLDRQWLGTLYLVAIYSRALPPEDVRAHAAIVARNPG